MRITFTVIPWWYFRRHDGESGGRVIESSDPGGPGQILTRLLNRVIVDEQAAIVRRPRRLWIRA